MKKNSKPTKKGSNYVLSQILLTISSLFCLLSTYLLKEKILYYHSPVTLRIIIVLLFIIVMALNIYSNKTNKNIYLKQIIIIFSIILIIFNLTIFFEYTQIKWNKENLTYNNQEIKLGDKFKNIKKILNIDNNTYYIGASDYYKKSLPKTIKSKKHLFGIFYSKNGGYIMLDLYNNTKNTININNSKLTNYTIDSRLDICDVITQKCDKNFYNDFTLSEKVKFGDLKQTVLKKYNTGLFNYFYKKQNSTYINGDTSNLYFSQNRYGIMYFVNNKLVSIFYSSSVLTPKN